MLFHVSPYFSLLLNYFGLMLLELINHEPHQFPLLGIQFHLPQFVLLGFLFYLGLPFLPCSL